MPETEGIMTVDHDPRRLRWGGKGLRHQLSGTVDITRRSSGAGHRARRNLPSPGMEPSLFRYIWQHSRRDQTRILLVVLASLPFYFLSLDLPKAIVNNAIQGGAFKGLGETIRAFAVDFSLPGWLGGGRVHLFDGVMVDRIGYLFGLAFMLLALVIINGAFKYKINIAKGVIGERMLRRMRFDLFRQLLAFRPEDARTIKPAEAASIIKDEVEPIGGFIGDAFIHPAYQAAMAATALLFILIQNVWLGLLTLLIVLLQAVIIPILRQKQLMLGKERQIASRKLAGRIGELVEGMVAVRGHGTEAYESAEIGGRLGNLFRIRLELYRRKFAVKYLNNLLAQLTPFLFYTIGGYFALRGSLDVGQLVAVIAAYKDIPPPIKELIDWDQQRNDVTIKYEQVVEQFSPQPQHSDPPREDAAALAAGPLVVDNLTLPDTGVTSRLDHARITLELPAHVALLGGAHSGKDSFARAIGRQISRYDGAIRLGEADLARLNPKDSAALIAYCGADPALFPGSVRDNIAYGLRRRIPRADETAVDRGERLRRMEALRTGNPAERAEDDWHDYALAGITSAAELDHAIAEAATVVGLTDDIYRFGMISRLDPARHGDLVARLIEARHRLHQRLKEGGRTRLIEPFDPERYNTNASIGENLLFGAIVRRSTNEIDLLAEEDARAILRAEGLAGPLGDIGAYIAATMIELFTGLPPGHPLAERFSFITAADLPAFAEIVARWRALPAFPERLEGGFERLGALALYYIEPRHRLGLMDREVEAKIVRARTKLHAMWSARPHPPVEAYDPDRYCLSAPIRDNLLLGRIGYGVAGANEAIAALIREVTADQGLDEEIFRIGLDYQVGPGGKLLFANQRTGVELARCIIRRPPVLIVDGALAGYRTAEGAALVARLRQACAGRTLICDLPEGVRPDGFDIALDFADGRLERQYRPAEREAAE
jgi:putative ABC transport system ATP-binding protein